MFGHRKSDTSGTGKRPKVLQEERRGLWGRRDQLPARAFGGEDEALGILEASLRPVVPFIKERFVSASAVVNPLLSVWDAAHDLGPTVSEPVEELLTMAVQRSVITGQEIAACVEAVRALAAQEVILSQLART